MKERVDLEAEEAAGVQMTAWGQIPATEHAARACGRIQVELPVHGENNKLTQCRQKMRMHGASSGAARNAK